MPTAPRSKLPILLFLVMLLGVGGAAFYFFVWAAKDNPVDAGSGSSIRMVATAVDAAPASKTDAAEPSYNPRPSDTDAGTTATVDAAPVVVADAAEPVIVVDAATVTPDAPTHKNPPKIKKGEPTPPTPPPVKGPPGFITIDSTPVYAVIFIDGKSYGETPLPRIQLAPGRHTVRAVSSSGIVQHAAINIESGKLAPTYRFRW
jgi:hypothetical protein